MNQSEIITFVYDGECPICSLGARHYIPDPKFGTLKLMDARTSQNEPIMLKINALGFDLDQGMVVEFQNKLYHGASAMRLLAKLSQKHAYWRKLLGSAIGAFIFYPIFKLGRQLALLAQGKPLINPKNP